MTNLAIKGHATRGSEVIALLEMLGGNNANNCYGRFCDTEFIADRRDYKMTNFEVCGVPRNIGIPEDVVAAHTTCYSELAVECPICRKVIEVKDGSLL
jgi:hypothetical protein